MSDFKHTPAPWVWDDGMPPERHSDGDWENRATFLVNEGIGGLDSIVLGGEVVAKEANVRLITAAPEMLQILVDIREVLIEDEDGGQRPHEWNFESGTPLEMVEWVIAKATGKETGE